MTNSISRPYIYDPALYPWSKLLQENWHVIKQEYDDFCAYIDEHGFDTRTITVDLDHNGVYNFIREVDPDSIIVTDTVTGEQIDFTYHTTSSFEGDTPVPIEKVATYIQSANYKNTVVNLTYSYNVMVPFRERIYEGTWIPLGLYMYGLANRELISFFPRTSELLQLVTGLESAMYSILSPGTIIHPHCGYSSDVLRCHIGLTPAQDAAIKVGDQILTWHEGSAFIFDDTELHEVWHKGDKTRIIFIVDFKKDPNSTPSYPAFINRRKKENKLLDLIRRPKK